MGLKGAEFLASSPVPMLLVRGAHLEYESLKKDYLIRKAHSFLLLALMLSVSSPSGCITEAVQKLFLHLRTVSPSHGLVPRIESRASCM